ncbi:DUF5696 domain-containing protein [Paenibacillus sp. MBLB4367]|uniref:DUF5696 domain-containing protein n=1 Tax=Paenibacillus sp. MBLB4367 TaxID=3384767 RepID=UPI0039080A8B
MKRFITVKTILALAALCAIGLYAIVKLNGAAVTPAGGNTAHAAPAAAPVNGTPAKASFPKESDFTLAAENANLRLKADRGTGHFIVEDKRSGTVWRSYPDQEGWKDAENTEAWKKHMQSPVFIKYVEFNVRKDQVKETNLIEQKGNIAGFQLTDAGFKLTFSMPEIGFVIPVEVRLKDDYVETVLPEEGLRDGKSQEEMKQFEAKNKKKDNNARITSIRLYSFLGAEASDEENGYLLIPDGPGTLIRFKKDRPANNNFYAERVFGEDFAYSNNIHTSIRKPVRMPVYGIKSGDSALMAVIRDGAEYASVIAAPSKSLNQYNWATAEHGLRYKYFQPTDKRKLNGFLTYGKDAAASDRSVRYYFLNKGEADYVGMAAKYRSYLMQETGIKTLAAAKTDISLPLNLFGADVVKGFWRDSYLPLTTTAQAKTIVSELSGKGVKAMSISYTGWQKGGYSEFGGAFPVDHGIGGSEGMRDFASFARSQGHSVVLDASSYGLNNTGRDGFRSSRDGLQDLGRSIMKFTGQKQQVTFVSPRFLENVLIGDLTKAKELGVDGLLFTGAVGSYLNSDYNKRYLATRNESLGIQKNILQKASEAFDRVVADEPNAYALQYAKHVYGLDNEYSFDLFVDEAVPFAQIALHGLVTYSSGYANMTDNYETYLLKNIEYGALPAFTVTYAESQDLLRTYSLDNFYSTNYKDWAGEIVKQYERFNRALGDVQSRFIVGHRSLDKGVYETAYSNGKRIVVNYNDRPYQNGGTVVAAKDFTVIPGGS